MNAFVTDLQALVARHVSRAAPDRMLRLVETLAAEEADLEFRAHAEPTVTRFTNLDSDFMPTKDSHVAVLQHETGLIWTAVPLRGGKEFTHAEAVEAARDHRLNAGDPTPWRLPTIRELLSIVDYARNEPAVDPAHFKGPYGYTWSSTSAVAPAGFAWLVGLDYGDSFRYLQGGRYRALAVRAGQS